MDPAETTEVGDLRSGGRPRDTSGEGPVLRGPLPPRPSAMAPTDTAAPSAPRGPATVVRKARPDPGPLRIALALTGMATASALVTALLGPSSSAVATAAQTATADQAVVPATSVAVKHVTRYVQLAPGQTAPPKAVMTQAPAPKPRVVVVTTKQSGK